jgi:aminopeptidase
MNKTRLKKYANLIATTGANVRPGQEVFIYAELDQPEFVKMLAEACYKLGARKVNVEWSYQPLERLAVKYQSSKVLGSLDEWQMEKWRHQAKELPVKIYLTSEDPDGLKGINLQKHAKARAKKALAIKPIRRSMENRYQWCIAGVPGEGWAKKVFPGMRTSAAVEKLWEAILDTARVTEDPIAEWEAHNKNLLDKCNYLNSLGLTKLIYKSKNGTDLTVGLIPEANFCGGGENTLSGIYFNPNMPTEEVFTSPKKGEAEGIVYSSLPLSHDGQLIENFWLKFEGGKAVDCGAERNAELLREIISADEGAAYLGECALVPYSSPIRKSGVLFYSTLYDENAACHLALGRGFTGVLKDFEKYTDEEANALGINDSVIHVDFMMGTDDLSIVGIDKDGNTVEIFKDGEWSI